MKNSDDTLKLFNEVMDYFDSLSTEEFFKRFKKSENGEFTKLFLEAGYFNKEGLVENEETNKDFEWKNLIFGTDTGLFYNSQKSEFVLNDLYRKPNYSIENYNFINSNNQALYDNGCTGCQKAA